MPGSSTTDQNSQATEGQATPETQNDGVPNNPIGLDELYVLQKLNRERMIDQTARQQDAHLRAVMSEHYGERYQVDEPMPMNLNSPTVTNHYHQAEGDDGADQPAVQPGSQATTPRKMPWWINAGIGAALLGTGGGGAIGVPMVWNAITQKQEARTPQEHTTEQPKPQAAKDYFLRLGED